MQQEIKKPVIWLAGDSTMQSYSEEKRPQWGWGEKLLERLETEKLLVEGIAMVNDSTELIITHRAGSPFEQQKRYEGKYYIVDNCAMAGRSSKTFREEGRLQDIAEHIQPGDYLIIQFGHNDAGKGKPERYVALEDFRKSLMHYVNVALENDAQPILISSIVLCPSPETTSGEAGEISCLLPEYGKVMEQYAAEIGIPYVDMNGLTGEYLKSLTKEQAKEHYLPDHVHLVEKGAEAYAGLAVERLKEIL